MSLPAPKCYYPPAQDNHKIEKKILKGLIDRRKKSYGLKITGVQDRSAKNIIDIST